MDKVTTSPKSTLNATRSVSWKVTFLKAILVTYLTSWIPSREPQLPPPTPSSCPNWPIPSQREARKTLQSSHWVQTGYHQICKQHIVQLLPTSTPTDHDTLPTPRRTSWSLCSIRINRIRSIFHLFTETAAKIRWRRSNRKHILLG